MILLEVLYHIVINLEEGTIKKVSQSLLANFFSI